MQYALFIYEDESFYGPGKSGPALQELVARHMAFNRELGATRIGGAGLAATASATTVRTANGKKTVHDGAFAETKEQLGGFYLIEAPDLDTAIAIAKRVPVLQDGVVAASRSPPLHQTPCRPVPPGRRTRAEVNSSGPSPPVCSCGGASAMRNARGCVPAQDAR